MGPVLQEGELFWAPRPLWPPSLSRSMGPWAPVLAGGGVVWLVAGSSASNRQLLVSVAVLSPLSWLVLGSWLPCPLLGWRGPTMGVSVAVSSCYTFWTGACTTMEVQHSQAIFS